MVHLLFFQIYIFIDYSIHKNFLDDSLALISLSLFSVALYIFLFSLWYFLQSVLHRFVFLNGVLLTFHVLRFALLEQARARPSVTMAASKNKLFITSVALIIDTCLDIDCEHVFKWAVIDVSELSRFFIILGMYC